MSDTIYNMLMPPVMIGMKVDSMYDNVDSYPAAGDIHFGRVCVFHTAAPLYRVRSAIAGEPAGIALHDHVVGAYGPLYRLFDAVSVLTRGRVWAEVAEVAQSNNIAFGVPVAFVPTGDEGGKVTHPTGAANALSLPHAIFRSGVIVVPPIWPSGNLGAGRVALVELNVPPYQPIETVP